MYFSVDAQLDEVGFSFVKNCIRAIEKRGKMKMIISAFLHYLEENVLRGFSAFTQDTYMIYLIHLNICGTYSLININIAHL